MKSPKTLDFLLSDKLARTQRQSPANMTQSMNVSVHGRDLSAFINN